MHEIHRGGVHDYALNAPAELLGELRFEQEGLREQSRRRGHRIQKAEVDVTVGPGGSSRAAAKEIDGDEVGRVNAGRARGGLTIAPRRSRCANRCSDIFSRDRLLEHLGHQAKDTPPCVGRPAVGMEPELASLLPAVTVNRGCAITSIAFRNDDGASLTPRKPAPPKSGQKTARIEPSTANLEVRRGVLKLSCRGVSRLVQRRSPERLEDCGGGSSSRERCSVACSIAARTFSSSPSGFCHQSVDQMRWMRQPRPSNTACRSLSRSLAVAAR